MSEKAGKVMHKSEASCTMGLELGLHAPTTHLSLDVRPKVSFVAYPCLHAYALSQVSNDGRLSVSRLNRK